MRVSRKLENPFFVWLQKEWKVFWLNRIIFSLVIIWIINLLFCEWILFHIVMSGCTYKPLKELEGDPFYNEKVYHVALIADPQLISNYTYSHIPWIIYDYIIFLGDAYMRTCFRLLLVYNQPDAIIFLGDLMGDTIKLNEVQYAEHLFRFKWIFSSTKKISDSTGKDTINKRSLIVQNSNFDPHVNWIKTENVYSIFENTFDFDIPAFYIPGNHDIGMFTGPPLLLKWYETNFGSINYEINIGNFSFIGIGTPVLEDPTTFPEPSLRTRDYVRDTSNLIQQATGIGSRPRILLTHIPLYRSDQETCGSFKRSQIKNSIGNTYQNLLSKFDTEFLLSCLDPLYVFSGDDHDYCEVKHLEGSVNELTVATFSWMEGTDYPGYALLSFYSPPSDCSKEECKQPDPIFKVQPCYSPRRLSLYLWYANLFFITVLILGLMEWSMHTAQNKSKKEDLSENYVEHEEILPLKDKIFLVILHTAKDVGEMTLLVFPFWMFLVWFMV
jgi:hypothetical protein